MTLHVSPPTYDDRNLYPLHEEDDVTETPLHEQVVRYLRYAIAAHIPDGFVTGNVCIYWEPGNYERYVAPDVFAVRERLPEPDPRVYHIWQDPPVIFVVEIGSRSTARIDEGDKLPIYAGVLGIPEHLFADVETKEIRLRRLETEEYEVVAPQPNGRLRSEQLDLEFEMAEDGFVWAYTRDGRRLLTYTEETERRQEAEARAAELERQLAELQARLQEQGESRRSDDQ